MGNPRLRLFAISRAPWFRVAVAVCDFSAAFFFQLRAEYRNEGAAAEWFRRVATALPLSCRHSTRDVRTVRCRDSCPRMQEPETPNPKSSPGKMEVDTYQKTG